MAFSPGAHLGPYEIHSALGAGGMGEVYRATDTKLGRAVALKILPDAFATDPDRVARFQREAKTLALLNHPNIGGIYGLEEAGGVTALVLELVEGPTLADRIAQGPIPLDEALPIAQQIAAALEAAHEQGIVHRDLKPANIKLRPDGTVKVLDFGLAKTQSADSATFTRGDASESPTLTTPAATRVGVIMGTAAYMSPEQARGKTLDKRTDIWAFGCLLFEMLTGRRPFVGDEVTDVMAAILLREPDLAALPATTPPSIRRLLRRCLQKDRAERLRDIGDSRMELRDALAKADAQEAAVQVSQTDRRGRAWVAALATLAVVATIAAVAAWLLRSPAPPAAEVRLDINTPPSTVPTSLALSPDGGTIAFVATSDAQSRLWVRTLDTTAARPLNGTNGAMHPFWSPDSRSIGFFADNKLKRVEIDGGSVRVIADVYRGTGGGWSRDGVILFSSLGDPISRVSATGGEPVELTGLVQQGSNFLPVFLPDGRRFLYFVRGTSDVRGVYVGQLDNALKGPRLIDSDGSAVYGSGHLFFIRQRAVFAQRFDPIRLELIGNPVPVAQNPAAGPTGVSVSVSDTGSIAYRTASTGGRRQFVWFDRSGKEIGRVASLGTMSTPSLSPDDEQVVGYRGNPVDGNVDVWILDVRRGAYSRVTSDVSDDVSPAWSPDGSHIVFSSNRKGTHDLYRKSTAGGNEELLFESRQEKGGSDWSSDGRFVLFEARDVKRRSDIFALPLDGHAQPIPVAQSEFEELRGQFSPDGKWVAYQSDESGRHEIYVQAFPGPGHKFPISTGGGTQVRWRRDGRELFYIALDERLMAVPIRFAAAGHQPEVGVPVALFAAPLGGFIQQADFRHQYDVASDGERFLMAAVTEAPSNSPINVILNWRPRP